MERRSLFKESRIDTEETRIRGYAAVFYRDGDPGTEYELWDGAVERIDPQAFSSALKRKDDVRALFNHNPDQILGRTSARTLQLSVDKIGLRYEIDLGETQVARDVLEHIRRGDVTGSSFGFLVRQQEWNESAERTIRTIKDVELLDVGPVTYPAYESTEATARSHECTSDAKRDWLEARAAKRARIRRRNLSRMLELDNP